MVDAVDFEELPFVLFVIDLVSKLIPAVVWKP